MKFLITLVLILLGSAGVSGCDGDPKIVRSKAGEPEKPPEGQEGEGDANAGDGFGSGGGDDGFDDGAVGGFGDDDFSEDDFSEDDLVGSEGAGGGKSEGSGEGSPPASAEAGPEGDSCESGDAGACFRAARPLILSNPQEAIRLYSVACDEGNPAGDGNACFAGGLLAKRSGDKASAQTLFKAACLKEKSPALQGCAL